MLFKTIKYYLATNAEMRATDRAAFRALLDDMQKKRAKQEELKTKLSYRGGCVRRYLKMRPGIWAEILPGKIKEEHCRDFWIFSCDDGCQEKTCMYYPEYVPYRDAYREYYKVKEDVKEFWKNRKVLRIEAAKYANNPAVQMAIDTLDAQCVVLHRELEQAQRKITCYEFATPEWVRPRQKGCFIDVSYSSKAFDTSDDYPGMIWSRMEVCPDFSVPCTRDDCYYSAQNQHYAHVRVRYRKACEAYRLMTGREWKPTKER